MVATNYATLTPGRPKYPVVSYLKSFSFQDASSPVLKAFTDSAVRTASSRLFQSFIIHPCDPTVVISYLIWLCDIDVRITYLISHSSSLSYNTVITGYFQVGCIINTKLPSCVDIIRRTSLGPSWCPESTRPTDSCFQGTSCENFMMYS